MCELDPACFLTATGLARQADLKKAKVKLALLSDMDVLLMAEEGIRGWICHSIYWYGMVNNKYMKDKENKKSSYLQYWDVNNLSGRAMSQKLLANNFEWMEDTSQFNEAFVKICNEESDEGYFLEVDVQYSDKLKI